MPQMLQMRIADPDEQPIQEQSFESSFREALLKEFPVASVVDTVDDKFVQFLEAMAALNLDMNVPKQPVQLFRDTTQTSVSASTEVGCSPAERLSHAA